MRRFDPRMLRVYVVTSGTADPRRTHRTIAEAAVAGGATAVQLRAPELDDDELAGDGDVARRAVRPGRDPVDRERPCRRCDRVRSRGSTCRPGRRPGRRAPGSGLTAHSA